MNKITIDDFNEIIKYPDDLKKGIRKQMSLTDVILSYPELRSHLEYLIMQKFGEKRLRYYPYMLSVIAGKEEYGPNAFYLGMKHKEDQEKFDQWRLDLRDYIIDNEHLHEFWMI